MVRGRKRKGNQTRAHPPPHPPLSVLFTVTRRNFRSRMLPTNFFKRAKRYHPPQSAPTPENHSGATIGADAIGGWRPEDVFAKGRKKKIKLNFGGRGTKKKKTQIRVEKKNPRQKKNAHLGEPRWLFIDFFLTRGSLERAIFFHSGFFWARRKFKIHGGGGGGGRGGRRIQGKPFAKGGGETSASPPKKFALWGHVESHFFPFFPLSRQRQKKKKKPKGGQSGNVFRIPGLWMGRFLFVFDRGELAACADNNGGPGARD